MSFPDFMFREENRIPSAQQNTPDIEGYYYTANDGRGIIKDGKRQNEGIDRKL